jgi:hypothetical protein
VILLRAVSGPGITIEAAAETVGPASCECTISAARSAAVAKSCLGQGRVLTQFAGLCARRPVVFVIEDIHWIDRSSLDWLSFLVGTSRR